MKGKLEMITAMLIFGSIGVFVRNIDLPSLEIAFLRATIGGLFLICTGFLIKHKISIKAIKGNALFLILSGGALGLNWVCLFQAYKYSTVSLAT
ncbi:MAG: EamA family transporter, partial [Tepidanaerobacteraceae bacterium]